MNDERIAALERRMTGQERQLRRYRLGLLSMVLALAGVVLVGATGSKDGVFDTVTAKSVKIENDKGQTVASLTSSTAGGFFVVRNNAGYSVADLSANLGGGFFSINNNAGQGAATLGAGGNSGIFSINNKTGEVVVQAYANEDGGQLRISNKTGEEVVQAGVDEYGNGVVGAFNRKGMGRTLQPGP
jgi:hypothetical protein